MVQLNKFFIIWFQNSIDFHITNFQTAELTKKSLKTFLAVGRFFDPKVFVTNEIITAEEREDKYPKLVVNQEWISLWVYNKENLFNIVVIETHFFSIWNQKN